MLREFRLSDSCLLYYIAPYVLAGKYYVTKFQKKAHSEQ